MKTGLSPCPTCFLSFAAIDPETPNRQGPDVGSQYQTGVYWMDPADEGIIRSIAAPEAAAVPLLRRGAEAPGMFLSSGRIPSAVSESTHGATATWPPETGLPCRTSLFHKDLYPSRKKSCCRPERSRRSVFLTGGGKLCFPQADHICVNKSAAGGCLRRSL